MLEACIRAESCIVVERNIYSTMDRELLNPRRFPELACSGPGPVDRARWGTRGLPVSLGKRLPYEICNRADPGTDQGGCDLLLRPPVSLWIIGLSMLAIGVSFLIEPATNGRLTFMGVVLPPSCPSRIMPGLPCPGCGLTRSFVAMSRGDVMLAHAHNAMGTVIYALCLLQIPYWMAHWLGLVRLEESQRAIRPLLWTLLIGFLAAWIFRIASEVSCFNQFCLWSSFS
jgi:hypothetical protein